MYESVTFDKIEKQFSLERMLDHIKVMNQLHRYTGTSQGEAFVDDLEKRLTEAEIPYREYWYEALCSLPVSASLQIDGKDYRLLADVYSKCAAPLTAEIVYDEWGEKNSLTLNEQEERMAGLKGKIVLTKKGGAKFAEQLYHAGGLGVINISSTPGGYIHHSNISGYWGTPSGVGFKYLECLPSAGISLEDGEELIRLLKTKTLTAIMNVQVNTSVNRSRMVTVDIPGKEDYFILIHGHYDSWYEGITDNATSDAILLEMARIFWENRTELKRSVRIAWWSGHSDARYAGSAWYCDQKFQELSEKCIGTVNIDLAGCKNSRQVRVRTTNMEGETLTGQLIREFTGHAPLPHIPMIRGADQSFWGVKIPVHIMFKYELLDEERVSPCPSGGPWWHTHHDTLDKLDQEILMRDALLNAKMACILLECDRLPVKMVDFTGNMKERLDRIADKLTEDFCLDDVRKNVDVLMETCKKLEEYLETAGLMSRDSDRIIKNVAGELNRLVFTKGNRYDQDASFAYGPFGVFAQAVGMTRENTPDREYLYKMTEFKRAANRCEGEIAEIINYINHVCG